jgi:hypothetical protein
LCGDRGKDEMVQEEKTGGQEERKKGRKRNSRKYRRREGRS